MDAQQAFAIFVKKVLLPEQAERFTSFSANPKGQRKILDGLCHRFERAIRSGTVQSSNYGALWEKPCFVFYGPLGFGVEFGSVSDAYDKLSTEGGWLVLLHDASAGIYRPETKWDDEKLIVAR